MPGWAGISGAPRDICLGFGVVLGHDCVCSPVWGILEELQKGLLPFPAHTRSILSPPVSPLQFPAAGNPGATVPCWLSGKERSCWCGWGMEGAMEPFVCCVGFAITMGQVPRVLPGYLELNFLSGEKQKNGALPKGKMLSQRCAAVGFCILLVFTFIR